MSNTAHDLTYRLLNALDRDYNVVDMCAISEIISVLENINITKELLETTRLGKHVNELRRRTGDPALARRAKLLVKRWRDLVIPDRTGVKPPSQSTSSESTQRLSPLAAHTPKGVSPAVTPAVIPRLCSPQVPSQGLSLAQKQGSITRTSTSVKPVLQQHQQRRQPLTSPAMQNVSAGPRNISAAGMKAFSPGLKTISPAISPGLRNISPGLRNISPGLRNISPGLRNISPGLRNISPGLKNISPGLKNISPGMKNISPSGKNISPSTKNISPGSRNRSPGPIGLAPVSKNISPAVKNLSPALRLQHETLRIQPETIRNITPSKSGDPYDSDSQDVILVDDDDEITKPISISERSNDASLFGKATKRPRSPVNGDSGILLGEKSPAGSRRDSKKARREPGGRKAKKRRNHTKSENRTVDHSLDPVGSPFLPISSASTSPALSASVLKNGISAPVPSPAPASVLIDDLDSRSPKPEPKTKNSRKNGCKKSSLDMEDYSTFIKNKIPAAGKKVKTTKELLEEIQARKSGKIIPVEQKDTKPKEDFLTAYDNKKRGSAIVTDIIELNDSNSSFKQEPETPVEVQEEVKTETKDTMGEPAKFEPVEVILARLPPIDRSWMEEEENVPICTCTLIYSDPAVEIKMPSPPQMPKRSIFELDYDDAPKEIKEETISSVVVPALPLFEEKIDPNCQAAAFYHNRPADTTDHEVLAVHNCYIPDVNGTHCDKTLQSGSLTKPACKFDQWGLRPYYDCPRELFHDIVPKYKFLDYSLDRCVKNLTKLPFDKYEPAEVTASSKEWLDELESKNAEMAAEANLRNSKTDDYHSAADSPFSENDKDKFQNSPFSDKNVSIKMSVNLDRDTCSNSVNTCDDSSQSASNNNDPSSFNKMDYEEMECDSVQSGSFKASPRPDSQQSFTNQSQCTQDNEDNKVIVKKIEPKRPRRFTYGDSVLTLPLSLAALNATAGFFDDNGDNCDLSCVFRTRTGPHNDFNTLLPDNDSSDLTYSNVAETATLEMKDLTDSAVERLKRYGAIETPRILDQDEDAVCDSDILDKKPKVDDAVKTETGALDVCVANGCPVWLAKLSRDDSFREWHEPVVRSSYNGEPLTVLPYVVID